MELLPNTPMDMPATYRICVLGVLESSWVERLWGMTTVPVEAAIDKEQTALVGEVADQAALVGIINALYNMGHTVVALEQVTTQEEFDETEQADTDE